MSWKKLIYILKNFDTNQPCPTKYKMLEGIIKAAQNMITTFEEVSKNQKNIDAILKSGQAKQSMNNVVMSQGAPNFRIPPATPQIPGMGVPMPPNMRTPVGPDTQRIIQMAMEKMKGDGDKGNGG
jgi:thymidine phosphorylase